MDGEAIALYLEGEKEQGELRQERAKEKRRTSGVVETHFDDGKTHFGKSEQTATGKSCDWFIELRSVALILFD